MQSKEFPKWKGLKNEVLRLSQESIIYRLFGSVSINGKRVFDDQSTILRNDPLSMFLYNQRAIFFAFGVPFLTALACLAPMLPSSKESYTTILVLSAFWVFDVVVTMALHASLKNEINTSTYKKPPSGFYRYFILDFCTVTALIAIGKLLDLQVDAFAFLLIGNMALLSIYIGERHFLNPITNVAFLLLTLTIPIFVGTRIMVPEPNWFYTMLRAGPLWGVVLMIIFSISMISWLRNFENRIARYELELLGRYEGILSHLASRSLRDANEQAQQFRECVEEVLKDLCSLGPPFWYESACVWFIERHQDRGPVLLPGPHFNFAEAENYDELIDASTVVSVSGEPVLIKSVRHSTGEGKAIIPQVRSGMDAPAAFIPLHKNDKLLGVLSLYGREGGPISMYQEEAFLNSFGYIISNSISQWHSRSTALALREMDNLFLCKSLPEVFSASAKILKNYLMADGCMVVFRPDPGRQELSVVAVDGFSKGVFKCEYRVGKGQTGLCAENGVTLRYDNVQLHRDKFDLGMLEQVEASHGRPIRSWMAIPIGGKDRNYGVIKVANRSHEFGWFSDEDQRLGEILALRLQVIIERFLYIEQVITARREAGLQSEKALAAQKEAEQTASMRQNDLMILTHQIQGPLVPIIGALSRLSRYDLPRQVRQNLEYINDLVEDILVLTYGITRSFALNAGREAAFSAQVIDVETELLKLCKRLQSTQSRDDLRFDYISEAGFPTLRLDRDVFISVMYSLLHNAMKYADMNSRIIVACVFERNSGEAVLKVKSVGEPIHPDEVDRIFDRFQRGQVIGKTGRHYSGVGLGLWVARTLMRAIGGGLTVELSPHDPRSSVFVVHTPK